MKKIGFPTVSSAAPSMEAQEPPMEMGEEVAADAMEMEGSMTQSVVDAVQEGISGLESPTEIAQTLRDLADEIEAAGPEAPTPTA